MPNKTLVEVAHTRHVATLWYLKHHPNQLSRVNGATFNALKRRGWVVLIGEPGKHMVTCLTIEGQNVLNTFDYDAHPLAHLIFKGLEAKGQKPQKQPAAPRQTPRNTRKATTARNKAVKAEIKPLPQSRREAVKEAAEMFISTPGVVVLTPQLINHPMVDAAMLGIVAWCAAQPKAPSMEGIAEYAGLPYSAVVATVQIVREAGFEVRVQ